MFKFICYPKCTTCMKAKKWLEENQIEFELRDIKVENPSAEELKAWHAMSGLPLKKFFNTSGLLYKSMELKNKLPNMSDEEIEALIDENTRMIFGETIANPALNYEQRKYTDDDFADLFIDLDMPLSLIRLVLSNVLIITIWYLLFKRPSVQYRNLEEAVGQKEAVKLEIMANIPYIILIINLFVQKPYIEEYPLLGILYIVMILLYIVFTVLQIILYPRHKDLYL